MGLLMLFISQSIPWSRFFELHAEVLKGVSRILLRILLTQIYSSLFSIYN
jgi:hypothetical protein